MISMFNCFAHFIHCPRLLSLLLTLGCEPFSCNTILGPLSIPFCCCCICSPSFLNSSSWEIMCWNWFSRRFWFIFQERPRWSASSQFDVKLLKKIYYYHFYNNNNNNNNIYIKSYYYYYYYYYFANRPSAYAFRWRGRCE